MGTFVISKRKNGEIQFNLKASNGQVILTSEGYNTRQSCDNGVESVRKNSQVDSRFERTTAKDGRHYFNLRASNGQVVGTSQMYKSARGRNNGIDSVRRHAAGANIKDETA